MPSPFSQDSIDQAVEETPKPLLYGKQRNGDLAPPPEVPPKPNHKLAKILLDSGIIGGHLADAYTTNRGLSRGFQEGNPLLPQNKIGNAVMLVGGGVLKSLLVNHLLNSGHPTAAKILGIGDVGLEGLAIGNNINHLSK